MYSILEMAKELRVSKQTIRRYISKLQIQPEESQVNTQTQYYSDESYLKIREALRPTENKPDTPEEDTETHTATAAETSATVPQQQYDAVVAAKNETIIMLQQEVENLRQQLSEQNNTVRWYQVRIAALEDKQQQPDPEEQSVSGAAQQEHIGFFRRIFRRS